MTNVEKCPKMLKHCPKTVQRSLGGAPKEQRRRRAEKRLSKRVFRRVRFFSSHLRFSGVFRANLTGAEKKRTLQKHPFQILTIGHSLGHAPFSGTLSVTLRGHSGPSGPEGPLYSRPAGSQSEGFFKTNF